jgi:GAF domain-containing protein
LLSEQLHGKDRALDRSQQAFRRAISRLGETLAATHDREKILEAVSETAQLAVGGQRGIFFEYAPAMTAPAAARTAIPSRSPAAAAMTATTSSQPDATPRATASERVKGGGPMVCPIPTAWA